MSEFSDTFEPRAEFIYLNADGPDTFEVPMNASGGWPFTSNCEINMGVPYYAVFNDVTVYGDEQLTTTICSLTAGTVVQSQGGGFALVGGITFEGPATYEVFLAGMSAQCGGADSGFISVPQTRSLGAYTHLVPIRGIIGPN